MGVNINHIRAREMWTATAIAFRVRNGTETSVHSDNLLHEVPGARCEILPRDQRGF